MEEIKENLIQILNESDLIVAGYLNLNQFSGMLFNALDIDNQPVDNWNDIHDFFIDFICEKEKEPLRDRLVIQIDTPNDAYNFEPSLYPNQKTNLIHITILFKYYKLLILNLGYQLLEIDPEPDYKYYAYWLTKKFDFTFKLLNKLSKEIIVLSQIADKNKQLSHTLQAMASDPLDSGNTKEISNIIKHKDSIAIYADEQADKAIKSKFYLEAIALQESRLSDKIALFLDFKKIGGHKKSLHKLIINIEAYCHPELINDLNDWRKSRNFFMHKMVRSSVKDELISVDELKAKSEHVALIGKELVEKVDCWFEEQVFSLFNPMTLIFAEDYEQNEKSKSDFASSTVH